MKPCTRRLAQSICALQRGSGIATAVPRHTLRRGTASLESQATASYGCRASSFPSFPGHAFCTSVARLAKKGSHVAAKTTQDTLLSAIESKVQEYQNAVAQVSPSRPSLCRPEIYSPRQQSGETDVETQIELARVVKGLEPLAGAWQEYMDAKSVGGVSLLWSFG